MLGGGILRADDRLRVGQRGERPVPLMREQAALQVIAEAVPLGERAEEVVEPGGKSSRGPGAGAQAAGLVIE